MLRSLVGSEMCIRDSAHPEEPETSPESHSSPPRAGLRERRRRKRLSLDSAQDWFGQRAQRAAPMTAEAELEMAAKTQTSLEVWFKNRPEPVLPPAVVPKPSRPVSSWVKPGLLKAVHLTATGVQVAALGEKVDGVKEQFGVASVVGNMAGLASMASIGSRRMVIPGVCVATVPPVLPAPGQQRPATTAEVGSSAKHPVRPCSSYPSANPTRKFIGLKMHLQQRGYTRELLDLHSTDHQPGRMYQLAERLNVELPAPGQSAPGLTAKQILRSNSQQRAVLGKMDMLCKVPEGMWDDGLAAADETSDAGQSLLLKLRGRV
eukprot:TRINITY_DN11882_c0_g2_i1.p1 TRINITY_DN11882_c0_g2~~TRINITY_DN11882_c0_g2_i1.p1  ORF type:complete len:319 (-),score=74.17 TRINITY_DN11882_c0_g2_i1:361-1317(-)